MGSVYQENNEPRVNYTTSEERQGVMWQHY